MKHFLIALLLLVPLAAAQAQYEGPNLLGMFFSDTEFSEETANHAPAPELFDAYFVLLNPEVDSVYGYEVGISTTDPNCFFLYVTFPNNGDNFGNDMDHMVGYGTPVPVVDDVVILSTVTLLYVYSDYVEISFGVSSLNSIPGHDGPVIANGADPDDLIPCTIPSGEISGVVATLNGVVAVEHHSLTGVKALFQ